jgi:hypothetical protein
MVPVVAWARPEFQIPVLQKKKKKKRKHLQVGSVKKCDTEKKKGRKSKMSEQCNKPVIHLTACHF